MITTLLIIFGVAFIIELSIFFYGLRKSEKTAIVAGFEPKVSIIVAARNEEAKISNCLASLSRIDYPTEKLEIIIVNDQSTDKTETIIKDLVDKDSRFKLVNAESGTGHLIGKANALSQAIDKSEGEIILFTDADCDVPSTWVKSTVPYFTKEIGIVGGFTVLKADSIFAGLQSLDWVFLYSVASATATIGFPLTAVGNNLAIRRTAYDAVGGYSKIPFSVTEDYMLTRKIIEKTGLKMVFPLNKETVIASQACKTWSQLYHQRKRWGIGALDMVSIGFFIFGIPYALNLLLLTSLFFTPINIFLMALGIKFLFELLLESYALKKIGSLTYIKHFLFFEFYYFLYVLALPWITISSRKVKWKDRIL
jgi:cellulose synthase/poly-beta-1,6-N-acetylglucosamine synthase-like glycosyltransferase